MEKDVTENKRDLNNRKTKNHSPSPSKRINNLN